MLDHALIKLEPGGFEAFSASGVTRVEDRHVVLFRHPIDRSEKTDKIPIVINVFFAVRGEKDVFTFFEAEALMDVGRHDLVEASYKP